MKKIFITIVMIIAVTVLGLFIYTNSFHRYPKPEWTNWPVQEEFTCPFSGRSMSVSYKEDEVVVVISPVFSGINRGIFKLSKSIYGERYENKDYNSSSVYWKKEGVANFQVTAGGETFVDNDCILNKR